MIAFKACARCHGDLLGSRDGEFSCLQCGRELSPEESHSLIVRLQAKQKQPELVAA
jgi:hypothetical protein